MLCEILLINDSVKSLSQQKIRTILFPYVLVNLLKERYISSVKSYKYLKNKLSIKLMVLIFLKMASICMKSL